MTVMILGTVAVVFFMGIMSLGGLPENKTPEAEQITSDSALTYGTDFTDWRYLTSAALTQWRYEEPCQSPCRYMSWHRTQGFWYARITPRYVNGVKHR